MGVRVAALYGVHRSLPALEAAPEGVEREAASAVLPDASDFARWLRRPPTDDERVASIAGS